MSNDIDYLLTQTANVLLPITAENLIPALNGKIFASAIRSFDENLYNLIDQLATIKGRKVHDGLIRVDGVQLVPLRCHTDHCGKFFALAGQTFKVGQTGLIHIGFPDIRPIEIKSNLKAYRVLLDRQTQRGTERNIPRFYEILNTQLARLGVSTQPESIEEKDAKALRMSNKKIRNNQPSNLFLTGYSVKFTNLTPEESIILQAKGVGSHKRFGCGVFQ